MLNIGDLAPDFTLLDDMNRPVRLSDFRGKNVVLYFYPRDDTPGCTKESCAFRDGLSELTERGAVVFGISMDGVASHQRFKKKFHLNFPLLSDTEKTVITAYDIWKKRSLYGRTFMGIERTTFVIDATGHITKIFPKVKVEGHFAEVLAAIHRT